MKRNLTRLLAMTLVLIFAVGLLPAVHADEDVRIRDTAYSETLGLRAAMTGKVSDTAIFAVYGPEGAHHHRGHRGREEYLHHRHRRAHRRDRALHPDLWRRRQGDPYAHLVLHRRF